MKLRDMFEGSGRDFVINVSNVSPPGVTKIVQVDVSGPRISKHYPSDMAFHVEYTVRHGRSRAVVAEHMPRTTRGLDDAIDKAMATAWAIAKAIKPLPPSVDSSTLNRAVQEPVGQTPLSPPELF